MNVHLHYGLHGLDVEIPSKNVTLIEPRFLQGIPDESIGFKDAVRFPINARPLKELIQRTDKVALVIPDITRPLPTDRLLPWIFEELSHVPAENFVIVNGTGSHRVNTIPELATMVGAEIAKKYRIVNHNSHDPSTMAVAGSWPDGQPILMNKEYVQADKRIIMGFIEPHFMAGFSGGYKAVFPGVADIGSIMRYHDAKTIGHPGSTWGKLEGNPTQEFVRKCGSVLPIHFCINVTQNRKRQITKFFCGEVMSAHLQGCEFAKSTAMTKCEKQFPIVVTTNGGYPLDQNLYQAVKGMHAAMQIVTPGGLILAASRCNDGFPEHGNFRKLLYESSNPKALQDRILAPGFSMYDQWEAQLLAMICLKARTALFSEIPADEVKRAHLEPIADIANRIAQELSVLGDETPIAVLPEGPMAIPYLV